MLQSLAGSAEPSSAPAAEEQKTPERGGVLGSSTNPHWESWSPVAGQILQ